MEKYRPFNNDGELIGHYLTIWKEVRRFYDEYVYNLTIEWPIIWVKNKFTGIREMIIGYGGYFIILHTGKPTMQELFEDYTFLDGSPCGVLE